MELFGLYVHFNPNVLLEPRFVYDNIAVYVSNLRKLVILCNITVYDFSFLSL